MPGLLQKRGNGTEGAKDEVRHQPECDEPQLTTLGCARKEIVMGRWGTGIFDNDTSCDWAFDLESRGLRLVKATLKRALTVKPEKLSYLIAEEALVACEVVARLQGNYGEEMTAYTEEVDEWVAKNRHKVRVSPELAKMALAAIERILLVVHELYTWPSDNWYPAYKFNIKNLKSRIFILPEYNMRFVNRIK